MSKMVLRKFARCVLILSLSTGLVTSAIAQSATPLAPNSIQVSRVQYDGDTGTFVNNVYTSPYSFPEVFNDPAGLTTGNDIQDIEGVQGSIYIDQFSSVPASSLAGTLSLPSNGPAATYPTQEPGSYITTSFTSKSEGALMLSLDGTALTYMGYQAGDQLNNVSNSYSPNSNYQLSPNSYTVDPNLGTAITVAHASESGTTATLTLSSPVTVPTGAYFTIAGMVAPYTGYNGTWPTKSASTNSTTLTLTLTASGLTTCATAGACGGTATYDPPYAFYDREVALIQAGPTVTLTPIDNANSGDNPRAAITVDENEFYIVGNSDSTTTSPSTGSGNPGLTIGARCGAPENNISYQLGTYVAADRGDESAKKHFKDNNWRGVGIYTDANGRQQLYVSKGSGSNGDDGLFQVGTSLPACSSASISSFGENGNGGATITELPGLAFPVTNQMTGAATPILSFGFWFANPTTLYVADEGNPGSYSGGANPSFSNSTNGTYVPSNDSFAGLEKWTLQNGTWVLDYTIQAGLNFNQPQTFSGYNDINGSPIESYTYGLRNMTGYNNGDGSVTIYGVTAQFSAVSGGESDPTSIVGITDQISATSLPANEQFVTLQTSNAGEVYRGVAYVPPANGYTRQTQTLDFQSVGSVTYGQPPITLSATATSNWPISYAVVSGPATISGNTLTITGQGPVTISATQSGNTDYAPATTSQTFTVAGGANTVTFTQQAPASAEYGSSFTVAASGLGTGAISYTSDGVVCSNSGANYTMISGSGTCTVTATQAADNDYASASASEYVTAQPAQGSVSLSLTSGTNPSTYGDSITFTATVTSDTGAVKGRRTTKRPRDLNGSVTWSGNTGCSASPVSGNSPETATCTTSTLGAGSDTVTATYMANDSNHTTASNSVSQTVNQATNTVTISGASASAEYGSSFTVSASGQGTGALTYSSDGVVCTNSGATYTMIEGSGTCTVTATQAADTNYQQGSSSVSVTAEPAVGSVSVSLTSGSSPSTYGQSVTFTATVTSDTGAVRGRRTTKRPRDLNGSVSWSSNTGCSSSAVSGNPPQTATCTTSLLGAGSDTVTATYTASDSNHTTASGSVSQTVNKAAATVALSNLTQTYNGSALSPTVTVTPSGLSYSLTGAPQTNAGSYTATATITDPNYSGSAHGTFKINKASQTITVSTAAPSMAIDGSSFTIVASASSGLPVTYTSGGSCTNSGGTYTITPKSKTGTACDEDVFQTGNGNYNAAIVVTSQTTVAASTAPSVTFSGPSPASAQYGTSFQVTAQSSDDTSVPVITNSTTSVCQITGSTTSGTTVTATVQMEAASGMCDLSAAWAVTTVYSAATKSVKVTAKKATPAGTFTGAPSTATDGATFTVTATSTSTATPTITGTPATVCSVGSVTSNGAGGYQATVTINKASGTCTTKAAWAAATDYDAATLTQTTTAE